VTSDNLHEARVTLFGKMKSAMIKVWLKRKKASGMRWNCLLAVASSLGGITVLFFTFWLSYAVIWVGGQGIAALSDLVFGKRFYVSHEARLVCSAVFVGLLFLQHFRTDPWYWGDYPKRNYVAAPALQMRAGVLGGLAFMLAYPGASANMVTDILLSGPRLVTGAWGLAKEAVRLKRLDEDGCAELLAFLSGAPAAVPYEELKSAGWNDWLSQLHSIDGVFFFAAQTWIIR